MPTSRKAPKMLETAKKLPNQMHATSAKGPVKNQVATSSEFQVRTQSANIEEATKTSSLGKHFVAVADRVNAADQTKETTVRRWARSLATTRSKFQQLNTQYRKIFADLLQEAYAVFNEIEGSAYGEEFYGNVRWKLKEEGVKVQKNTTNAALIVRFVCGSDLNKKTVGDYSTVLVGARRLSVAPTSFSDWLQQTTMTAVIAAERTAGKDIDSYPERLRRARLVVLRVLEARETRPILSATTTSWQAERQLGKDGVWIALGTARRRNDRESFYADIDLLMMLTPNVDIEAYVLNQLAKTFLGNLEEAESRIQNMEQKFWADELWEQLVSAGLEESKQANGRRARR